MNRTFGTLGTPGTPGTLLGNFPTAIPQCRSEVDDAGLLAAARRGNAEAFSTLFARFQGPIYRYAAHMCGRDAGDDIVQETFLSVLRDAGRFDATRGTVGAYLFGVARHHVFRRLRVRDAAVDRDDVGERLTTEAAPDTDVLAHLTRAETIDAVREAIATLPPVFREVVVLCELQETSYADAAAIAGCPVGTVRSRLHRARALLVEKLGTMNILKATR